MQRMGAPLWRLWVATVLALACLLVLVSGIERASAGPPNRAAAPLGTADIRSRMGRYAPPNRAAAPLGTCPGQTTALPMPITLAVNLQRPNTPAPSLTWAVPVTFTLYPPGNGTTVCLEWRVTLDQYGRWQGMPSIFTGVYDARILGLHTLRNVKRNLVINGPLTINMGTLYEGDANADNVVNILDFGRLRSSYFLDKGMVGFEPRADFDENNTINILDFGLLRGNYFMEGDIQVTALATAAGQSAAAPVTVTLAPLTRALALGEVAGFSILADATAQPLIGLDVELFYRPAAVAVTDKTGVPVSAITPGDAFNVILQNRVDSGAGRILFSAATFDAPATGPIEIGRFYLKGIAPGAAAVRFGARTIGLDPGYAQTPLTLDTPVITVGGGSYRLNLPLLYKR